MVIPMKTLPAKLFAIALLCCMVQCACAQVRVRMGPRLPSLRAKKHAATTYVEEKKPAEIKVIHPDKPQHNSLDGRFYVKWSKGRKLAYNDFKYNRNLYDKFIPDQDTDLVNTIYPDYIAFYNSLKSRMANKVVDEEQDELIEKRLKLMADSLEKGYISAPVSIDINPSFTISIDSPAASIINLAPVVYPVGESSWYFNIIPVFSIQESWMIVKSADILQHEQIHFDIFELYARKMRKSLLDIIKKNYNENLTPDLATEVTPVYDQLYLEMNQMQAEFDKQTGEKTLANAPLIQINEAWVKKLKTQLDLLSEYEIPEGTIILK